jgi:hypothetical protein
MGYILIDSKGITWDGETVIPGTIHVDFAPSRGYYFEARRDGSNLRVECGPLQKFPYTVRWLSIRGLLYENHKTYEATFIVGKDDAERDKRYEELTGIDLNKSLGVACGDPLDCTDPVYGAWIMGGGHMRQARNYVSLCPTRRKRRS